MKRRGKKESRLTLGERRWAEGGCQMGVFIECWLRSADFLLYHYSNGFFWSAPVFLYNTNGSLNGSASDRFNIRSCKTKLDSTDIKLDLMNFHIGKG